MIIPSDPSEPRISRRRTTRYPKRRRGLTSRLAPLAALLLVVLAISALAVLHKDAGSKQAAPSPAEPGPRNAEAASAYAAGVQALHDDNWSRAEKGFARAVELDPDMADAQLRLAAVLGASSWSSVAARESFAKAVSMRSQLSERDREFMNALAPVLQESPPDRLEAAARLEAATRHYPDDAELFSWLASVELADPDRAIEAASRAIAIDRSEANAWELRGRALAAAGRLDEAMATLEECATISLETTDCLYWAGAVAEMEGRCDEAKGIYRRSLSRDPSQSFMYPFLAEMLFATGQPLASVQETALQANKFAFSDEDRFFVAAFPANLAFARGDFSTARAIARENLAAADANSGYEVHFRPTLELVELALEEGDDGEAMRLAADFSARRESWTLAEQGTGADLTPWLLRLAHPGPGGVARVQAWADASLRSGVEPGLVWTYGLAATARTPEEARQTLSAMPRYAPLTFFDHPMNGITDAELGHVYFLAGRYDVAIPALERATRNCRAVSWPYARARAAFELGQAREQKKDTAGACGAYAIILKSWANARPRSVTAERATRRTAALHCPQ